MNKLLSSSPCFKAGTKVLTKVGYKEIEKICLEDEVLTHTNKWSKVKNVGQFENKELWKIKTRNGFKFYVTPNHLFWTVSANGSDFSEHTFKSVENLTTNDYLISLIKPDGSGKATYDYDRVVNIEKTDRVVTVYGIEVEAEPTYVVNDKIVYSM